MGGGALFSTPVLSFEPSRARKGTCVASDLRREITKLLPRLRSFACTLTGDPARGDDLVLEGCAHAFANPEQLRAEPRLDSWLSQIIHTIWLDQKRAQRVRRVLANLDDLDLEVLPGLEDEAGAAAIVSQLMLTCVLEALEQLPLEQRVVISLVCIEGRTYEEAAAILAMPIGTVTSRLVRARQALYAKAVGEVWGQESVHDQAR